MKPKGLVGRARRNRRSFVTDMNYVNEARRSTANHEQPDLFLGQSRQDVNEDTTFPSPSAANHDPVSGA
jgi:hypothetical protein